MDKSHFNSVFQKFGSICIPTDDMEGSLISIYLKEFKKILLGLKQIYSNMPDIEVNFIDGEYLSAHAAIHEGKYYIAIEKGALNIMRDVFMRMLANPTIFPLLGDVSKEIEVDKIDTAQVESHLKFQLRDIDTLFPKNGKRALVSFQMLHAAMSQLFLHEIAHLIRGHYKWLILEDNIKSCHPLIRQSMEVDADRFGINLLLNQMKLKDEQTEVDLESEIFIWAFALTTMLNLIPKIESMSETDTTPPFAVRYRLTTVEAVYRVFESHKKIDKIKEAIYRAKKMSQYAFSKIQTDVPYTHFNMAKSQDTTNHYIKINNAWNNIEYELSKRSIIDLNYF